MRTMHCDQYDSMCILTSISPLCCLYFNKTLKERLSKINKTNCRPSLLVCRHSGRVYVRKHTNFFFLNQSNSLRLTLTSCRLNRICTLPTLSLHGYLTSLWRQIGGNGQNVGATDTLVIDQHVYCHLLHTRL